VRGNWYDQSEFQDVRRPNLWYNSDDNRVYRWGGWAYYYNVSYPSSFWSFESFANGSATWEAAPDFTVNGLGANTYAPFGGASVVTEDAFYSLGGSNVSDSIAVQGFVKYDFSTGQWSNSSSADATSNGYLVQAQAAYVSNFGSSGFLAFVGGVVPDTQSYNPASYDTVNLVDISIVTLYDLASGTWYHQQTTGDIPAPRSEFCMVSAPSQDKSYFDMYDLPSGLPVHTDTC
jgi:hypothetical protein